MREWLSLSISFIALLVSAISLYYNRIHQLRDFNYKIGKDKETFLMNLKSDLNSLCQELHEIKTNQTNIDISQKDKYSFYLDKYTRESTEKYLPSFLVRTWSDLKIDIDETLNFIIYQKNYSSIYQSITKLRNFIKSF